MKCDEDYELLAWENKQMALFFVKLGLTNENISDLIINGTPEQVNKAHLIINKRIISLLKEKLSNMNSDQIFDFTYNNEGI